MNTRIALRLVLGSVVLCAAASAVSQGLYTEGTTRGGPLGDRVINSKAYMMPKMYRHEGGDGHVVIIRLDKEMLYLVNPAEKTYSAATFTELEETMKKSGEQMDARMQEMQEKLKDMPENQRQMMEKMMSSRMGMKGKDKKVDVNGPGERMSLSGYSCVKYSATSEGDTLMTVWTTKDVKGFEALKHDWEKFSSRMMALNPGNGKLLAESFKKIEGFPLQTKIGGMVMTVTKVEKRTAPASQFEVPSDFAKTDWPLKGMER